ncbi:MAG: response regulator [Elusimicrobia bacterium]|nr:response regulator [Elusimicrobiota bacterium]
MGTGCAADAGTLSGLSLFIVEDDDHFRETLMDAMSLDGADMAGAGTGREALEALSRRVPGAIIIDMQLPDMDGLELCRLLRKSERLKDVPVVFITASVRYSDPRDRAEVLRSGAGGCLSKPVSVEDLREEIRRVVPLKSL